MKVLIATDGSRSSEIAFDRVLELIAQGRLQGKTCSDSNGSIGSTENRPCPPDLVVLTVSRGSTGQQPPFIRPRGTLAQSLAEPAAAISNLARAKELLASRGLVAKHLWRVGEDPVQVIVETAIDEAADLIVLGCRPRLGRPEDLLGSVSSGVLRRSPIPVLVVKDRLAS